MRQWGCGPGGQRKHQNGGTGEPTNDGSRSQTGLGKKEGGGEKGDGGRNGKGDKVEQGSIMSIAVSANAIYKPGGTR